MASPIEQFEIKPISGLDFTLLGYDISFTNSALWMALAVIASTLLLTASMGRGSLVPSRWQNVAEMLYEFIANMVQDNAGQAGKKYFPFVFTLFMFVLLGNLLGMIPYSFTYTSHIIVTFALAMMVFLLVTLIGIIRHGFHFLSFFVPPGVPFYVMPILVPIEILSYLSRPVSLSVRLFANMMAGHTMLKVFAGFSVSLGVVFGLAPLAINVALVGFEILVAFMQAYVFTILTCLYIKDAIELH
jgi:F-type H+-transporting ATPase subunit a